MKWLFCINDFGLHRYWRHIQAAVKSWRGGQPICLCDGKTSIQAVNSIGVIGKQIESRHIRNLENFYPDPVRFGKACGAYLRLEIPRFLMLGGWKDKYVLYTDCDVLFGGDLSPLTEMEPELFAAGPQSKQEDWSFFNSGVLWMNVENCREAFDKIIPTDAYDLEQGPMNDLFGPGQWDRLPLEYNWKPYWGVNPNAKIVHFHGVKPVDPPRNDVPQEWRKGEGFAYYARMVP